MVRPKKEINEKMVLELAKIGATIEEIASACDCVINTIRNRFLHIVKKGHNNMRLSVRRQQMVLMDNGNCTMAIWLGKQVLGQRDQVATESQGTWNVTLDADIPVVTKADNDAQSKNAGDSRQAKAETKGE